MVYNNDGLLILLINAVRKGDLSKVEELLKERSNINAKSDDDYTFLHLAARYGHLEIVKALLEDGADVNAKDNKGFLCM